MCVEGKKDEIGILKLRSRLPGAAAIVHSLRIFSPCCSDSYDKEVANTCSTITDHPGRPRRRFNRSGSSSPASARSPRWPTARTKTWTKILKGESGLRRVESLDAEQNPCLVRGDVDNATITNRFLDPKTLRNTSRFSRMAVEAAGRSVARRRSHRREV